MSNLAVAVGLILVIEGSLWALAPGLARKFLEVAAETPESTLRMVGALAAAAGVLVIWIVQG